LISTLHSSGTITDGTTSKADDAARSQASPMSSDTLPSGMALQPTGSSAAAHERRAAHTAAGTSMRTRKRFSGRSPAFRCTTVSRQASDAVDAA
jgi:hypothetical protein